MLLDNRCTFVAILNVLIFWAFCCILLFSQLFLPQKIYLSTKSTFNSDYFLLLSQNIMHIDIFYTMKSFEHKHFL